MKAHGEKKSQRRKAVDNFYEIAGVQYKLTVRQRAGVLGISPGYLARIENGAQEPGDKVFSRMVLFTEKRTGGLPTTTAEY